jgi:hypothetical protein
MSLMNLQVGILIYEDPTSNPKIRTPDITREYQGVPVVNPKSDSATLEPGESKVIATTLRSLATDNTTQFTLSRPFSFLDVMRLTWTGTGTNPVFRTKRNLGTDATSQVTMTRVAPNTVRMTGTGGTLLSSAAVVVGDTLKMEPTNDTFTSVFGVPNQGVYYPVQAKGTNYIDFLDNGGASLDAVILGASFDLQLRVFSAGTVKIGDTVQFEGTLNAGNLGSFQVVNLSSDYLEFVNIYGVAETFTNTNTVSVFDRLIGLALIRGNGPFGLQSNVQATPSIYNTMQGESLHLGTIQAHTLTASNPGTVTLSLSFQLCSLC